MSRHHPVKASVRHKGQQFARQAICRCGHPWRAHAHKATNMSCQRCRCVGFQRQPGEPPPVAAPEARPERPCVALDAASTALRQACTCLPHADGRGHTACPSCGAWDHGRVLLVDGRQVPKGSWLLRHTPVEEKQP